MQPNRPNSADYRTRMQLVPSAPRQAAVARPRVAHHVAADTVYAQVAYNPRELVIQRTAADNVKRVGDAITNKQSPRPIDLMLMGLLLDYRGESPIAEEQYAQNALTSLADREFNVHSDVSHVLAEQHVRLCYAAARKLAHVHKLNDAFQRRLVRQLLVLRTYADQQDNPNVLFVLSCLRNCIVERPSDESTLHTALRYGIAIGQLAVGAAFQQAQTSASGAAKLAKYLLTDGLRPNGWYEEVKNLEGLCRQITMARCEDRDADMARLCDQLLLTTGKTLHKQLAYLDQFDVNIKRRLKEAINSLEVRQVDNEWDLAFACLDALQRNVHALISEGQLQHVLHQVHQVITRSKLAALRYKCIELLRDVRGLPGLQPICDLLLHMAGQQGLRQVEAVAKKRRLELILRKDAILHAQDDMAERRPALAGGDAPPLGLDRRGSLRMLAPRFGHPGAARPVAGYLESPGASGVALRPQPSQPERAIGSDPSARLRLDLEHGEGLALACESLTDPLDPQGLRLAAMLRAGVTAGAATELPTDAVRTALAGDWWRGPLPKSLLALSVLVGSPHHVRAIVSRHGLRRGFVTPAAVREAEQLGRSPRFAEALQAMRSAVETFGLQEAPAPRARAAAAPRAGDARAPLTRTPSDASERTLVERFGSLRSDLARVSSDASERTLVEHADGEGSGPTQRFRF